MAEEMEVVIYWCSQYSELKMHLYGLNDHNTTYSCSSLWFIPLMHMYNFQIKITEYTAVMILWNRTPMQGKTLVLYTDGLIEPFVVGLNFESRYSRQLCLFHLKQRSINNCNYFTLCHLSFLHYMFCLFLTCLSCVLPCMLLLGLIYWINDSSAYSCLPSPMNMFTGGSRLSRIFWEHENLSDLSIIRLIQLLLLKTNIRIKHCSTSKGTYWDNNLKHISTVRSVSYPKL